MKLNNIFIFKCIKLNVYIEYNKISNKKEIVTNMISMILLKVNF